MYLLVISEVLEQFANTFNDAHKYSFLNSKNLRQPIKMKLSKKLKRFSRFASHF